jgi:hypothetical protein
LAIDTKQTFIDAYNFFNGNPTSYEELLSKCAENASLVETPPQNALNNARGAWYAWMIAIDAMKYCTTNANANYLIKLPNARQFDAHSLYVQSVWMLIDDFRAKLNAIGNVNLVTSNPDFVIINRRLRETPPTINAVITHEDISCVDDFYKEFIETCELDDVIGHVGAKTSVRPDRRIQLLHEGSLTKAIYAHLQTRLWLTQANGVKYFAVSLAWGDADIEGLRSVATHSIASASLTPQPAVDGVVELKDSVTANLFFSSI